MSIRAALVSTTVAILAAAPVTAGVGDPQVRTDHPWYPGELACSTFERLFATQAEQYRRVTGIDPKTDEQKALASWFWRNTHYWHGEEGAEDLWGKGFSGGDLRTREYWTGLFAHGFGLCGTTHSQWTAEMEALLGHGRGRGVGVAGHNSFEVYLTGGEYGEGKWALLDHDLSTVVFNRAGTALLSIPEVKADWQNLVNRAFNPEKQRGWLVCGLHPGDGGVYQDYNTAEYFAGYSGPPPMVHLRRGETLRRYLRPGLEDGRTFVFWGRNYQTGGVPGPERSLTWVNQPEAMHGSTNGAPYREGQARFANAVYTYRPDFTDGSYREGVAAETPGAVTFEFTTPFIIGATPPDASEWGVYQPGGRNGLVVKGSGGAPVAVSVDRGRTWSEAGRLDGTLDLTDHVKGRRQYLLRLGAGAAALRNAGLVVTTVCQVNSSVLPRLRDGGTRLTFEASGQAVVSAGPNLEQARTHVVEGAFGTPAVTLELSTPRGERVTGIHAAAHVLSGNPPNADIRYQIEYSLDAGASWQPLVKDWQIARKGDEPADFWSQSLCWGSVPVRGDASRVRVRFRNDGGRAYARAELHLTYQVPAADATKVTFQWKDERGERRASHLFTAGRGEWTVPTGTGVETRWVELEPIAR
ncbi:MAG: hypothetical protein ACK47B_18175 [Armatimonadota bacterium]